LTSAAGDPAAPATDSRPVSTAAAIAGKAASRRANATSPLVTLVCCASSQPDVDAASGEGVKLTAVDVGDPHEHDRAQGLELLQQHLRLSHRLRTGQLHVHLRPYRPPPR
jgi:hypothetical protein